MIRTVYIPRLAGRRLGQTMVMTPGCMSIQDPTTGLWSPLPALDANGNVIASTCNSGDGTSPVDALPGDPGGAAAVAAWAAQQQQSGSLLANNQSGATSPSLVLAESLMSGNIPSPLPGLGITVPMSTSTRNWLLIGAVIAGVVLLSGGRQ